MDIELARHVVRTAFRAGGQLEELLPVLKERLGRDEYEDYLRGIAAAIAEIGAALTNKALAAHPELADEIETKIARHGRFD